MPKVIGLSAIIGFAISVVFLVALSFYATALRAALRDCQSTHTSLANQRIICANKVGVLETKLKDSGAALVAEQQRIGRLEARLDAVSKVRRCASANTDQIRG